MRAAQTLQIFKVLNRYFKNEEDATKVVEDIEQIVDNKFEGIKGTISTKQDLTEAIANLELRLIQKMNSQFTWLIGTFIAMIGLAVANFQSVVDVLATTQWRIIQFITTIFCDCI